MYIVWYAPALKKVAERDMGGGGGGGTPTHFFFRLQNVFPKFNIIGIVL